MKNYFANDPFDSDARPELSQTCPFSKIKLTDIESTFQMKFVQLCSTKMFLIAIPKIPSARMSISRWERRNDTIQHSSHPTIVWLGGRGERVERWNTFPLGEVASRHNFNSTSARELLGTRGTPTLQLGISLIASAITRDTPAKELRRRRSSWIFTQLLTRFALAMKHARHGIETEFHLLCVYRKKESFLVGVSDCHLSPSLVDRRLLPSLSLPSVSASRCVFLSATRPNLQSDSVSQRHPLFPLFCWILPGNARQMGNYLLQVCLTRTWTPFFARRKIFFLHGSKVHLKRYHASQGVVF